ncbi:MAG: MFS transporter [Nocardioidaceae bacterium]
MDSTLQIFGQLARNGQLMRVVTAYACFAVSEFVMWIAILIYAYDQGGATTAGLVVVAQLAPAAVVAPLVAPLADRRSPVGLLAGGYAIQGAGAAATSVLLFVSASPYLVYLGAVVVSVAISTTRPAQSALLPSVTREVRELTAANGVIGWVESVSAMLAGAGVGLILTVGTVAHVCALAAVLLGTAVVLVAPLRTGSSGLQETTPDTSPGPGGLASIWRDPPVRLMVTLLGAEYVVIGALDVLFVVLALDVLDVGASWVGYLNMAYGAGGVLFGALAALLVGRRLGPVIVGTAALLGVALAVSAFTVVPAVVVALLAVVGGSRALFDVATRALLQRAVPAHLLARVFGWAEGLSMAGIAIGATVVPALVSLGGGSLALVGVAALLPAFVLARVGRLRRLDQHAQVPVVEIALLRSLPIFRLLPAPALEGLARALQPVRFEEGTTLVREGDLGECYFAIVEGSVDIQRSGHRIATLHRGDGLGEIALLRTGRRTATAVAATAVRAFRMDRDPFLTAVNGHVPTLQTVTALVRDTQAGDAKRDSPGPPADL